MNDMMHLGLNVVVANNCMGGDISAALVTLSGLFDRVSVLICLIAS